MQVIEIGGNRRMPELYDEAKMNRALKDPKVKEVRVFRMKKGLKLNIEGHRYKVIAVRPNGKVTLKPM